MKLSEQLANLENGLNNFWLADLFPAAGTTKAGIRKRATAAGRKAMAIMTDAAAAGDTETEHKARELARSLVRYVK